MLRRQFHQLSLLCGTSMLAGTRALAAGPADSKAPEKLIDWPAIEAQVQGRLGVAVLDTGSGRWAGQRMDERFAMCSAFKWLAAAQVLQRVDQGQEQLQRRIVYGREALLPWSPVTKRHVGGAGLSLGELCEAAVAASDNAAANLILHTLGGPAGLTQFLRGQGDAITRLDRWEPELNEARPQDPRDTSSPRAMATLLNRLVLGPALSPASRQQLAQWLQASTTNRQRLGAGLPARWRLGSKTGTGRQGSTNDVGIYWPEGRAPLVVALFLTETQAPLAEREAALARAAEAARGWAAAG